MATEPSYLLDTNILLRLSKRNDLWHGMIMTALDALTDRGADICCTAQNVSEFWNVSTRPSDRNGFGLSIEETDEALRAIERTVTVLPDNDQIYRRWRVLVVRHRVSGVQVHDARLAAAMQVHGISHILTLNQPDFVRYTEISVVHPQNVPV
jgi:predicted nucleic acid-binding protein